VHTTYTIAQDRVKEEEEEEEEEDIARSALGVLSC
jgi:hypothetical protein